jgi:hypothetical protein
MPHNLFDDRSLAGSRPQPWAPAIGEGSAAINAARLADAIAGRRRAPPPKKKPMRNYRGNGHEHGRARKYEFATGASADMASYMRHKRSTDPKYKRPGGAGSRGHGGGNFTTKADRAVAAAKCKATWDRKLGATTRASHHRKPAP